VGLAPVTFRTSLFISPERPHTVLAGFRESLLRTFKRALRAPVPNAIPKQLTDACESVDSSVDERFLQVDLVRLDRAVPTAGRVGSRNPCASASAQRPVAQIPEAIDLQQPTVCCLWGFTVWRPEFSTL
jgi:hypothetical protein